MEFKGTKGKWELTDSPFSDEKGDYHGTWDIISGDTTIVGVPAYRFYGLEFSEARANAQLISKCPEILEMLKLSHANHKSMLSYMNLCGADIDAILSIKETIIQIENLIKEATTI